MTLDANGGGVTGGSETDGADGGVVGAERGPAKSAGRAGGNGAMNGGFDLLESSWL